jgi:hypothetical protein
MKMKPHSAVSSTTNLAFRTATAFLTATLLITMAAVLSSGTDGSHIAKHIVPIASAGTTYASLASANLNFSITPATASVISANDNWSGFANVEGYFGQNLTATHGIDPQTILGTEFSGNTLPNTPVQVNANKGNPSAYNAGGLAEFDSGTYLAIGFQGNVQANPYLVFYVNSTGRSSVTISYEVKDIDGGSNNAVSPVALQYRVGSTGLFTNLPDGYIADATDGPNIAGRTTNKSVTLPAAAANKPQVQIRIITTNAANTSGGSTPDEWIGVNNVVVSSTAPTAAPVEVAGRVLTRNGRSVSRALVSAIGESGQPRTAYTNTFGYYRITGLTAGQSYVISVQAHIYSFEPQLVSLNDSLAGFDFIERAPVTSAPSLVDTAPIQNSKLKSRE